MCEATLDAHYNENAPLDTVWCCPSCYNWTRRRTHNHSKKNNSRRKPFFFPIQALRIHLRYMKRVDKKRFDSRMIKRLASSLVKTYCGKVNLYFTLLCEHEKNVIRKLASHSSASVHMIVAEHYRYQQRFSLC